MKVIKLLTIIVSLLILVVGSGGYYVTSKIAGEVNRQYANKQIGVKGIDKQDYFVSFKNMDPYGFPYKISWQINGWFEESRTAKINYDAPIYFGYDLLLQKLFVTYSGEITALYKPESRGFGAKLKVDNYSIEVDLPLTIDLVKTIRNMKDPFEIINHVGEIYVYSDSVEIFDLVSNEKFYDKEYEKLKISFLPQKKYANMEDFLQNIPQHLTAKYLVKTNPNNKENRKLPVSLFYGFSLLPSGFDVDADLKVKTQGSNFQEIQKGMEMTLAAKCLSPLIDFDNAKFSYSAGTDGRGRDYKIEMHSNISLKPGLFDELFNQYNILSPQLVSSPFGKIMDTEIRYIIKNKDLFKFKELENNKYDYKFKLNSSQNETRRYLKIDDLSIFSQNSGFKLQHEMETLSKGNKSWSANGLLFVKNYPEVVDFSSGYIYRFGKFRFLKDEARSLYVDVNKAFLKDISDHPDSNSNDLSFSYNIDSKNLGNTKIGSVKFHQISKLYVLMLYQKLFDKVGNSGDVLERMKDIIPDLDPNEPLLKKLLPKIIDSNNIKNKLEQEIEKSIPKEVIKKVVPKDLIDKAIPKELKNGLLKEIF
jgi:hypothetical protein